MINEIHKKYKNVIILHPFNFNSIYRKDGFLFSKIFDSIVNQKQITIGNTYFYRELLHPKFIVEQSIIATHDDIIGSGRLIFVNDFIRSLYYYFDLNYDDYVTEDSSKNITNNEKIFYLDSKDVLYSELDLFNDTIIELTNILNKSI
jgi:hypothetical protein